MMSNPSAGTDGLLLFIALKSFAWLVLAGMCAILATVLAARKQAILALVQDLVQRAEKAVDGSDMGAEKKKLVIAQLEAAGVRMTAWLSRAIDSIVAELNKKDGGMHISRRRTRTETLARRRERCWTLRQSPRPYGDKKRR